MDQGQTRIEPLASDDQAGYEAVVQLGDRFDDRLGQLPYAAFEEARDDARILVARDADTDTIIGYALYRLPRNEVSLTHLCVEPDARGMGIAGALVKTITERHSQRLGIRAKCRDDYGLADTWQHLGFTARAKTTGRGRDRTPMTVWWKDHGHPDLFTEYELPVELRAAIDLNIVLDLASPATRKPRSEFLVADHLAGRLQLVVSSGMIAEIKAGDPARRRTLQEAINPYPVVNADPQRATDLEQAILAEVQKTSPQFPVTDQDHRDVGQVAHAAAAGLSVFLTWDESLIKQLGPVVETLTGIKLMKPVYVVLHLDELANAEAFRLDSLAGSGFTHARAGTRIILYASTPIRSVLGTATLHSVDTDTPARLSRRHRGQLGLTRREFDDYLAGVTAAACLTIADAQPLPVPYELAWLRDQAEFQPPQSYRYLALGDPEPLHTLAATQLK
ncbi:GNAT family N-acetyltransferase [Amycolatopsis alkalitolerans]|nr:GNAT family N-acetyltransferase [Amycolatopsis alkalitolerans]